MQLSNWIFLTCLIIAIGFFAKKIREISFDIKLGRDKVINDRKSERWVTMARVALGQSKMVVRPIAGILHILIYLGFVIINIEVLEIIIDGVLGTHRVFAFLGPVYDFLIGSFEWLALAVLVACIIFLVRRNILRIRRFHLKEMTSWPKSDANIILVAEILLMIAFLTMNGADRSLQLNGHPDYIMAGAFPISQFIPGLENLTPEALIGVERFCWWFHIIGILIFLNYVPYSKHFHIFLAFPNTWYSKLTAKGEMTNLDSVKKEVELMLDPNADPYAQSADSAGTPGPFGAKDITDLTWKNIMDAYSCTECGRCSSVCPANQTGKILSPRKIMMDTRDRAEELGKAKRKFGLDHQDGKSLLHDYIGEEELWACTTCNACAQACPVNIDPVEIILDLRRYLIMEESKSPEAITSMFNNVENNGAPWAFPAADRLKWTTE